MKTAILVILSLVLNGYLATGVLRELNSRKQAPPLPGNATEQTAAPDKRATAPVKAKSEGMTLTDAAGAVKPFHWSQLETEDYLRYIANLRAIKCPEETIRDIIYADVEKLMAKKFRALNIQYKISRDGTLDDYWKSDEEFARAKMARDVENRKLYKERRELLATLLGVDYEAQRRLRLGLPDDDGARHPYVDAVKLGNARDVWAHFDALEADARLRYQYYSGEEIKKEFLNIARQRDEAMGKLLTPQEKEEFLLRISYISGRLRTGLAGFEPTEKEFRAIFKPEYQQFLDMGPYVLFGSVDPADTATAAKKLESQQAKESAIRNVLGEARFQDYLMNQSSEYQQLFQVVQSGGQGKEEATKVYQMKQATEAEMGRIAANQSLSPEQRQQAMAAVQQEAAKAVQGVLGESNFNRYRTSYGRWLNISSQSALPPGAIVLPNGTVIMKKP